MLRTFHASVCRVASIATLLLTLAIPFAARAQLSGWSAHAGNWNSDAMGDIHQIAQDSVGIHGFYGIPANILQRNGLIVSDFSIAASMGTSSASNVGWNAVGFAFRIQDTQNFYRVHFFPGWPGGALRFEKFVNGQAVLIQPDANMGYTPQLGAFYRLRLDVSGSTFTARLSDPSGSHPDFTLTYTDTTFASGGVGLSNDTGPGFFRNVFIEQATCGL